jgi:putative transposase
MNNIEVLRSYKFKHDINNNKLDIIEKIIYPEWKRIASILLNKHINDYKLNYRVNKSNKLYQPIESTLSERYKDCINRQVVGMLKSKLTNFKTKFNKIVLKHDGFDDDMKMKLCFINKYNLYFYKGDYISKNIEVSSEIIKISKWIFKKFIGKFPNFNNINMVMQDKVAQLELSKNIDKDIFPYVIRLSTHVKGSLIVLPLKRNKYFDKFKGDIKTSTEFIFNNNKLTHIKLTKNIGLNKDIKLNNYTLSIDIGLNNLISTNNGELFGIRFLRQLKRLDKNLIELVNKLKKDGGKYIKLSKFKEYNNLVNRIKDYTKNEVNRIINKLYFRYKPTSINVEELNFQNSKLSKRLNRLLSKFGLGSIYNKLKSLEIFGVKINYIDAAYSSLTCNNCGYVDKNNRKIQEEFKCKCCGLKQHADVNSARTLDKFSKRFGDKIFWGKIGREDKLKLIINDFIVFGKKFWMNNESVIQAISKSKYSLLFRDKIRCHN